MSVVINFSVCSYYRLNERKFENSTQTFILISLYIYLPKTKKFGCVGRGDLTSLFFSKVAK